MIGIRGVHVFRKVREEYSEHILLTQAISAIEWRRNNGPIDLYTDKESLADLEKFGLTAFYDNIDTEVLAETDDIPWDQFFPASKIKVLQSIKEFPVAFIDTDFIFWERLDEIVKKYDISYAHREGLFWRNYPPMDFLGKREGYKFPEIKQLSNSKPINVGFFVMNNKDLRDEYVEMAMDYMKDNREKCLEVEWADDGLRTFWKSLFVEQRLLGALVDKGYYTNNQIFPYDYYGDTLSWEDKKTKLHYTQDEINKISPPFFHLWGEKSLYSKPEGKKLMILKLYQLIKYFMESGNYNLENFCLNVISYSMATSKKNMKPDPYNFKKYLTIPR